MEKAIGITKDNRTLSERDRDVLPEAERGNTYVYRLQGFEWSMRPLFLHAYLEKGDRQNSIDMGGRVMLSPLFFLYLNLSHPRSLLTSAFSFTLLLSSSPTLGHQTFFFHSSFYSHHSFIHSHGPTITSPYRDPVYHSPNSLTRQQ